MHEEFYGSTNINVTDFSKPVSSFVDNNACETDLNEIETCAMIQEKIITYPFTKKVSGVNMVDEIELLRQAIYELKTELCIAKPNAYSWCS